jgi:hypothetical protein
VDVDVNEGGHEELTIKPVHNATVAGDDVAKVLGNIRSNYSIVAASWSAVKTLVKTNLYFEGPLKSAGEKSAKGPDHAGKNGHEEGVDEERVNGQG